VNVLAVAGTSLIVGTDLGVYLTADGGATWLSVGSGLPKAPIMDIRYHQPTNQLFAATFGRGMWRVQLPASIASR
jgi:ligand-binding sensor domain-containing protein